MFWVCITLYCEKYSSVQVHFSRKQWQNEETNASEGHQNNRGESIQLFHYRHHLLVWIELNAGKKGHVFVFFIFVWDQNHTTPPVTNILKHLINVWYFCNIYFKQNNTCIKSKSQVNTSPISLLQRRQGRMRMRKRMRATWPNNLSPSSVPS